MFPHYVTVMFIVQKGNECSCRIFFSFPRFKQTAKTVVRKEFAKYMKVLMISKDIYQERVTKEFTKH